ncbi:MAG: hypothetical protein V4613_07550 [Bacteroidota bacterium]
MAQVILNTINTLDSIIGKGNYILYPSFFVGIIGSLVLAALKYSKPSEDKKLKLIGFILFGQAIFIYIIMEIISSMFNNRARNEIKAFVSQQNISITINDTLLDTTAIKTIGSNIKGIKRIKYNHSSPRKKFTINIISRNDVISLFAFQDSYDSSSYWIFWDKYNTSKENEIGSIFSTTLYKYRAD